MRQQYEAPRHVLLVHTAKLKLISTDLDRVEAQLMSLARLSPLSLDLTSRVDLGAPNSCLSGEMTPCIESPEPMAFPMSTSSPV